MKQNFYLPTRVVLGTDCVRQNAALLSALGKKALIVTGAHSARANGSLVDLTAALESQGLSWALYDKVEPNPGVDCIYAGAAAARAASCDFVVAIGGGSPMDAAKGIALLAVQDIPPEQIFAGGYEKRLPLCCIPTTAGTGSEVTQYAILTNDRAKTKTSLAAPLLFPDLALLDSRYLQKLRRETMVNTVVDALSHAAEGYLSIKSGFLSDALALRALQLIGGCLERLAADNLTAGDLWSLLEASTLGGAVIAQTGTTAVHAMGYALTYCRHIDHGRANGLLLGAYLRQIYPHCARRVDTLLQALGQADLDSFCSLLDALLGKREEIPAEVLSAFADSAMQAANIANCLIPTDRAALLQVYLASFGR